MTREKTHVLKLQSSIEESEHLESLEKQRKEIELQSSIEESEQASKRRAYHFPDVTIVHRGI